MGCKSTKQQIKPCSRNEQPANFILHIYIQENFAHYCAAYGVYISITELLPTYIFNIMRRSAWLGTNVTKLGKNLTCTVLRHKMAFKVTCWSVRFFHAGGSSKVPCRTRSLTVTFVFGVSRFIAIFKLKVYLIHGFAQYEYTFTNC